MHHSSRIVRGSFGDFVVRLYDLTEKNRLLRADSDGVWC